MRRWLRNCKETPIEPDPNPKWRLYTKSASAASGSGQQHVQRSCSEVEAAAPTEVLVEIDADNRGAVSSVMGATLRHCAHVCVYGNAGVSLVILSYVRFSVWGLCEWHRRGIPASEMHPWCWDQSSILEGFIETLFCDTRDHLQP